MATVSPTPRPTHTPQTSHTHARPHVRQTWDTQAESTSHAPTLHQRLHPHTPTPNGGGAQTDGATASTTSLTVRKTLYAIMPNVPSRLQCRTARNGDTLIADGSSVVGGAKEQDFRCERYAIRNAFCPRIVPPARQKDAVSAKPCILWKVSE